MIQINMRNGDRLFWDKSSYTEYECNYNLFIIKRGDQWVGIYNMDAISYIEIEHNQPTE